MLGWYIGWTVIAVAFLILYSGRTAVLHRVVDELIRSRARSEDPFEFHVDPRLHE